MYVTPSRDMQVISCLVEEALFTSSPKTYPTSSIFSTSPSSSFLPWDILTGVHTAVRRPLLPTVSIYFCSHQEAIVFTPNYFMPVFLVSICKHNLTEYYVNQWTMNKDRSSCYFCEHQLKDFGEEFIKEMWGGEANLWGWTRELRKKKS